MAYGNPDDPLIDVPAGAPLGQAAVDAYAPGGGVYGNVGNYGRDSTPGWTTGVVDALQALSKSPLAKQPDASPLAPARITEVPAGRPRQAGSLDALVQLLERRQAQYGTLSGQPVAQPRALGLLGF